MKNKVVMITGARGALGGALAERCAAEGARLALVLGHRTETAASAQEGLHLTADLSDPAAAQRAVDAVLEQFGRIDALFNIAGGFAAGSAATTSPEALDRQLGINFRTAFNTTTAALPGLLERGEGFVMGVAAGAAISGSGRASAYAASKGAVLSYFRSLVRELQPEGVRVALLVPMGTIDTPANRQAMPKADPADWIPLTELVDAALFLEARGLQAPVPELRIG